MRQAGLIGALSAVSFTVLGFAQVPAGPPFLAGAHPNPIVTFAESADFQPADYADAQQRAGIELLGLSDSVGRRESVSVTESHVDEVRILGRNTDVLFYPVVLQRFLLVDGEQFLLYSFRDPRPTGIPSESLASVLNQHAFSSNDDPRRARFGSSPRPEELDIRGSAALLFDQAGQLTLFWQDEAASHVAMASVPRDRMFRIVGDLL
jgi:hypothetical protein